MTSQTSKTTPAKVTARNDRRVAALRANLLRRKAAKQPDNKEKQSPT